MAYVMFPLLIFVCTHSQQRVVPMLEGESYDNLFNALRSEAEEDDGSIGQTIARLERNCL